MKYICIFKNHEFGKYKDLPYIDSLALTVFKYLYSDKASDKCLNMRLDNCIELYDFMNISLYFLRSSTSDFGEADIKKYLREMEDVENSKDMFSNNIVRFSQGYNYERYVYIIHASWVFKMCFLWAAYIYFSVMSRINNPEEWNDVIEMLKSLMKELYFDYEHLPIMQYKEEAIQLMMSHIEKKQNEQKLQIPEDDNDEYEDEEDNDDEDLQSSSVSADENIKENKKLKDELKALKDTLQLLEEQEPSSYEIIIFFSQLLSIPLNKDSINLSAFAVFLKELTGRKIANSSIQRVGEQEKSKPSDILKKDAIHLVKLLMNIPRPYANHKAEVIYKLIDNIIITYKLKKSDFEGIAKNKKDQFRDILERID